MWHSEHLQEILIKSVNVYGFKGIHPAANLFPLMSANQLEVLIADVYDNGFVQSIKVTKDNFLIDGRNRLIASVYLEKDVDIEIVDPADPLAYVQSCNLMRRRLTSQQVAIILSETDKLKKLKGGKNVA